MTSDKFLFEEFPPVSEKQWKQKIQFDLKGDDYSSLITHTLEGIDIKPFYHRDSYQQLPYSYRPGDFVIVHEYDFMPAPEDLAFSFKNAVETVRIIVKNNVDLQHIDTENLIYDLQFRDDRLMEHFLEKNVRFVFDPVSQLLRTGNWFVNESEDFSRLASLKKHSGWYLEVDMSIVQNAGANIVQQIAYALAQGNLYIRRLGADIIPKIRFKFAVGYHYFFEIAKFKAFRYLWKTISKHRNEPVIYAVPTLRNKTLFDPYVNMLRTGMEMMAAVLGGADETANYPYNYIFKKYDHKAMRLASNQLVLLKQEAKFNKRLSSSEGSYYMESVAVQLAEKALEILKTIENAGGLLQQLYDGTVQRKIEENARKEQQLFDEGKLVLTGTNKYIDKEEKPPAYDKNPFVSDRVGERTLIKKIIPVRLSEKTEKERIKNLSAH